MEKWISLFIFLLLKDKKQRGLCWPGLNKEKPPSRDNNLHMATIEQDESLQQFGICAGVYTAASAP